MKDFNRIFEGLTPEQLQEEYLGEPAAEIIAREKLTGKSKWRGKNTVKYVSNEPNTAGAVFKPCS